VQNLEIAYTIFSVSLDEAFGMRRAGRTEQAHQLLTISTALCNRLAWPLGCLLQSMMRHARHFGTTPNLAPLDPENFQSSRSQRVGRFNELFSRVLLTRKSQFLSKISTLGDLVEDLGGNFVSVAVELCEQESIRPDRNWEVLDAVHYDLNTCLRETAVLYKSFLHALPESQLENFEKTLHEHCASGKQTVTAGARHLARRRMAFLKGQ
jgi:hypothetical protein